jgi:ribonuclease-3
MARHKRNPLPKVVYLERVDDNRKVWLDALAERIGVKIKNYNLINRALSHKSYTNELGYSHNEQYEKLEFFGDGVLGLIVNEYLFKAFPDYEEGELAKIKSAVVSEVTLAELAREIGLGEFILVGKGESRSGGSERPSLLADILEALIGAVFMDQGLPSARRFVLKYIETHIRAMSNEDSVGDPKSYFQETVQKAEGVRPVYSVMKSSGPDHSRTFRVSVSVRGKRYGVGMGKSKKEAEQDAAEKALKEWELAKERRSRRRGGRDQRRDEGTGEAGEIFPEGEGSLVEGEGEPGESVEPRGEGDVGDESGTGRRRGRRGGRGGRGERSGRGGRGQRGGVGRGEPVESSDTGGGAMAGEAGEAAVKGEARSRSGRRPAHGDDRGGRGGRGVAQGGGGRGGPGHAQGGERGGRGSRGGGTNRPRTSHGDDARGGSRDRGPVRERVEDFVPPAEVVDPIAWAAGESYSFRRGGGSGNPGRGASPAGGPTSGPSPGRGPRPGGGTEGEGGGAGRGRGGRRRRR